MWSLEHATFRYDFNHVAVSSVQIEGRSYRVSDAPAPRSDGIRFGEDFADPGDIKLSVYINFQHVRNLSLQRAMLREAAEAFLHNWDAAPVRLTAGETAELTIPELGAFEGRPRRAEWDWSTFGAGYLTGTATFVRDSMRALKLDENGLAPFYEATVRITPPTETLVGWTFPLYFPLTVDEPAALTYSFTVGGEAPSSPIVELHGPIEAGAEIEVFGRWILRSSRRLAYDEVAVADSREGRTFLAVNGSPTNWLAPSSARLSQLALPPGTHQVSLRGISHEGTAAAKLRWRDMKAGI